MPLALAPWAQGLDLARLPDDLALAARQFLTRADEFDPAAGRALSERLANAISLHVGPPPPGVPAWDYLSAVLAERTRRETERLTGGPRYAPSPVGYGPTPAAYVPAPAAAIPPAPPPPAAARGDDFVPPS